MATFLFAPTGVSRYYLALIKALDQHLGAPQNLTLVSAAGGSLPAATYFYKVTALDNAGGETLPCTENSVVTALNNKNTLTWNTVPNAVTYNIYRSTSSGTEILLVGTSTAILPAPQPNAGVLTVSFIDDGTPTAATGPVSPPIADTTQQTALYKMPAITGSHATVPVSYTNSDIAALYPADLAVPDLDGGGGGGSGGGGGTGVGGSTGGSGPSPTASGGIAGGVSFIPEIVQFSNRAVIALGNGFPCQIFSDPSTPTNPATTAAITAISVDAFGVVTVTTAAAHNIPNVTSWGANVIISGITPAGYNGTYPILQVVDATHFKFRSLSAIGLGAGTVFGSVTATSLPIISTFTQAFPVWAASTTYLKDDLIVPIAANSHYYKCIQSGISAAVAPAFPITTGGHVQESSPSKVIWQEAGLTTSTSPPPQAAAHIKVFAGSLWAWNTGVKNTPDGLDGPTSLRMSDSNNPNSWNPINQAFLDKDDGTEGTGLSPFTISGFGIPPEGSLVAFKQFAGYQVVGVFGSSNFLIQRIKSSMGCIAPRTIQFITGYGLARFAHLGIAVFDGMNDKVISEEINPYIFPDNVINATDITTVDFGSISIAWASQTAFPPMYITAVPIGASGGKLSRLLCFDLVLKAWTVIDLPFGIGTIAQFGTNIAAPVTVLGSFSDGTLHRWQSGDVTWDNSIDAPGPSPVLYSVTSPLVFDKRSYGSRFYCRQVVTRGRLISTGATMEVSLDLQLENRITPTSRQVSVGSVGNTQINTPVNEKLTDIDCVVTGSGIVEIDSFTFMIKPESGTVPAVLT